MENLPRHIAIIMDGNGRWAQSRGHNRTFGHVKGARRAREIIRACGNMGIEALTLYTFSTENWQRPTMEVNFLMLLLLRYLRQATKDIVENNLRFRAVGSTSMLPQEIQNELKKITAATEKNTGMFLNIALSYGSRQEITQAVQAIAREVSTGVIRPEDIREEMISERLFTHESPDPDLLIRTGGDQRISNFLLWQAAYAEFFFLEKPWPEFTVEDLTSSIQSYSNRERRFGKVLNES